MTAEARIRVGELSDTLVVPVPAVVPKQGQHFCYVLEQSGATRRAVKIGRSTENYVEVLEGLSEGEVVAFDARSRAASDADQDEGSLAEGSSSVAVAR